MTAGGGQYAALELFASSVNQNNTAHQNHTEQAPVIDHVAGTLQ